MMSHDFNASHFQLILPEIKYKESYAAALSEGFRSIAATPEHIKIVREDLV